MSTAACPAEVITVFFGGRGVHLLSDLVTGPEKNHVQRHLLTTRAFLASTTFHHINRIHDVQLDVQLHCTPSINRWFNIPKMKCHELTICSLWTHRCQDLFAVPY